jgi:hypothetical protein
MTRRHIVAMACAGALLGASSLAEAQVAPATGRATDLSLGGSWSAPVGLGDRPVDLHTSSGGTFTQFRTSNRLGQALGLDLRVGVAVTPRVWAEGVGGWARVPFQSQITDDSEDADDVTLTEHGSRFSVGGALRYVVSTRGATSWFVRGGGGWMREVAGASTLTADGLTGEAGVGMTRVWRERPRGALRQIGFRVDGRVQFRAGGLTLGDDTLRLGPAVGGALTMGFR